MSKWVLDHGDKMYHIKAEDRDDDVLLTPRENIEDKELVVGGSAESKEEKAPRPNVTNFDFYQRNLDTVVY